jgi:hypothetical protein
LLDVATITGPGTESRDSDGEVTTSDATIASNIKCAWHTLSGSEKLVASGIADIGDVVVRLESSMVGLITADMTITVAARSPQPEKVFRVKRALESSLMVGVRVLATEG